MTPKPYQLLLKLPLSASELKAFPNYRPNFMERFESISAFDKALLAGEFKKQHICQIGCLWRTANGTPWSFYFQIWSAPVWLFGHVFPHQYDFANFGRTDGLSKAAWRKKPFSTTNRLKYYRDYEAIAKVVGYKYVPGEFSTQAFVNWVDEMGFEFGFFDFSGSRRLREIQKEGDKSYINLRRQTTRQCNQLLRQGRQEAVQRAKAKGVKEVGPTKITAILV